MNYVHVYFYCPLLIYAIPASQMERLIRARFVKWEESCHEWRSMTSEYSLLQVPGVFVVRKDIK